MVRLEMKLFETADGIVHWVYPMAGQLTVCGQLGEPQYTGPWALAAPTCIRCVALVQLERHGDVIPWVPPDSQKRQG